MAYSTPKELRPGDDLGRYELLLPVAKGGMGQVWAARLKGTRGFQKLVAIKTLLPSEDEDGEGLESMLFGEASLASHIQHPNVAAMLDLGEQDGTLYLVMEWVDGEPLDYVIRSASKTGGIPLPIAVHLIVQALRGLQGAHEATDAQGQSLGIVHRDISPQNLLVTYNGEVKLVDFGVAKATHQMSQPTVTGQVKGKFAYMSPEQVRAQPVDARTDIFAMGIVLYLLTVGRHPFKGETPADTLLNILSDDPVRRPAETVRGYPPRLEAVILRALAKDRDQRFSSANEMRLALETALPTGLQTSVEKSVTGFIQQLFAERMVEQSQALKLAMESRTPPKARRVGPHLPRSTSTMRAVTVPTQEEVSQSEDGIPTGAPLPQGDPPSSSGLHGALARSRRGLPQAGVIALAVCLAGAVIGFEELRPRAPSTREPSAAAAFPAHGAETDKPLVSAPEGISSAPVVAPLSAASSAPSDSASEATAKPASPLRHAPRRDRAADAAAAPMASSAPRVVPQTSPDPVKPPDWDPLKARR